MKTKDKALQNSRSHKARNFRNTQVWRLCLDPYPMIQRQRSQEHISVGDKILAKRYQGV